MDKKEWHAGAKIVNKDRCFTFVTTLPQPFNTFFVAEGDIGHEPLPMMIEVKQHGSIVGQQVPIGAALRYRFKKIWVEVDGVRQSIDNVMLSDTSFLMYPVANPLWWDDRDKR